MSRRYLLTDEVGALLRRGTAVEGFLGACSRDGKQGVRWLSLRSSGEDLELRIYESADIGSSEYLDVYEFGPLNSELQIGEADETFSFADLQSCLAALSRRFPGASERLVNQGIIQDEYADFILRDRKNA